MATSLYDLSIGSYLQVLDATDAILAKAITWCAENNAETNDLLELRLADDMLPLSFQLHMANTHSLGTMEGLRAGTFKPPRGIPELDYAGFHTLIKDAAAALRKLSPEEVDSLAGSNMKFIIGEMELPFTAENFVMSFSLPNFYFHTTAAYAILRAKGVPLGKRDYLGQMRMSG